MNAGNWFAVDEMSRPILNGDTVTDDDGNAYKFISFTPPVDGIGGMAGTSGTVTVRSKSGKLITTTRFPFNIRFVYEEE